MVPSTPPPETLSRVTVNVSSLSGIMSSMMVIGRGALVSPLLKVARLEATRKSLPELALPSVTLKVTVTYKNSAAN